MKKNISILLMALAIANIAHSQNNEIIFNDLKPSAQPIIADFGMSRLPGDEGSKCPNTQFCYFVFDDWVNRLSMEDDGKKYIQSLESKPPHLKKQILMDEFKRRYEQLSAQKDKNICIDDQNWDLYNDNTGYYIGKEESFQGDVTAFTNNSPYGKIVLRDEKKLLQKIPNEFITEDVFKKLKLLLNGDRFARICGKPLRHFSGLNYTKQPIDPSRVAPEPRVYEFVVNKSIELYKKGEKSPTLTIPLSWYR